LNQLALPSPEFDNKCFIFIIHKINKFDMKLDQYGFSERILRNCTTIIAKIIIATYTYHTLKFIVLLLKQALPSVQSSFSPEYLMNAIFGFSRAVNVVIGR